MCPWPLPGRHPPQARGHHALPLRLLRVSDCSWAAEVYPQDSFPLALKAVAFSLMNVCFYYPEILRSTNIIYLGFKKRFRKNKKQNLRSGTASGDGNEEWESRQNRNKEAKKWKHIPLKLSFLSQDPIFEQINTLGLNKNPAGPTANKYPKPSSQSLLQTSKPSFLA